jgi:hypothetical protein
MSESEKATELLRQVLENLHHPEALDEHPWTRSLMVGEEIYQHPAYKALSPGAQLAQSINNLFLKMMPSSPPKQGLRLDNRWGEFGIIASQYFAPINFSYPQPETLRDAWIGIDQAIGFYVGKYRVLWDEKKLERYRLISNENEVAPNSTISDWHRKGIERFAEFLSNYEKKLEMEYQISPGHRKRKDWKKSPAGRALTWTGRILLAALAAATALGLWQGFALAQKALEIKSEAELLAANAETLLDDFSMDAAEIQATSELAAELRGDLAELKDDASFLLAISPKLGWIPKYGGDIAQTELLLELAIQASTAGDEMLRAVRPLLEASASQTGPRDVLGLVGQLKDGDSQLVAAQVALANLQTTRQKIDTTRLSPTTARLLTERFDPMFERLNASIPVTDVLQMARLAPRLMGAAGNGPQVYLLLIQNEDELRPTGGFLTAAGLLQMENGKISDISIESSDMVDDLSKPYPKAPWQLDDYMMAEILLFRDANWFTDFPTTAEWTRFLYSYTRAKKIDGVIAIDQQMVQRMLEITGPIRIEGEEELISVENALAYMRSAKENTPAEGVQRKDWDRKQFIERMAKALIERLLTIEKERVPALLREVMALLDEKHILLQFDDPEMSALIDERQWDGAVEAEPGADFLMAVDSNVGFNKTNAKTETAIEYTVDLRDLEQPKGSLAVTIENHSSNIATGSGECIQAGGDIRNLPLDEREYLMDDCYWSYLRVYSAEGSQLTSSTPQAIPQPWPLREQAIPARTDTLDENIAGTSAFGSLIVIPPGDAYTMQFKTLLPPGTLTRAPGQDTLSYRLKIQKQPGTDEIPVVLHVMLPPGYEAVELPEGFSEGEGTMTWSGRLSRDLFFELRLRPGE